MKRVIHFFVLSCRKATELIDKKTIMPLSWRELILLRWHKGICDACTAYEKQSGKIDSILSAHTHPASDKTIIANPALKEKIKRSIN